MVAIKTVLEYVVGSIFYVEMACGRLIFFLDCQTVSFSFKKLNAATKTQSTVDDEHFWRVSHASPTRKLVTLFSITPFSLSVG